MRVLLFLLLLPSFCFGQNLVPNPSFEVYDTCPDWYSQVNNYVADWDTYNPTSDYYNVCATPTPAGVPSNNTGWQYPATGNAYCGFIPYVSTNLNVREAIGAKLNTQLTIGQTYYSCFKISLANSSGYAHDKVGLLFLTKPYCEIYNPPPSTCISPSVELAPINMAHVYSTTIITDTANWVTISGTFTADSAYEYIAAGGFFDDNNINIQPVSGNFFGSYYYIDDVCVSADSMDCLCNEETGMKDVGETNRLLIHPNPTQGIFTVTNATTEIEVYDMVGCKVLATTKEEIDLSSYAKGIYLVRVGEAVRKIVLH